jgi:hypothetical protein
MLLQCDNILFGCGLLSINFFSWFFLIKKTFHCWFYRSTEKTVFFIFKFIEMDFVIPKYQPVEILIPTGFTGNIIQINDQQSLRNKYIVGIEFFPVNAMKYSPISTVATIPNEDVSLCTLELFMADTQIVNRIPLNKFNRTSSFDAGVGGGYVGAFNNDVVRVNNWVLSWDKCNLYISKASDLTATNRVVTLGVYYVDNLPNRLM